jgi:hypothetical protein
MRDVSAFYEIFTLSIFLVEAKKVGGNANHGQEISRKP